MFSALLSLAGPSRAHFGMTIVYNDNRDEKTMAKCCPKLLKLLNKFFCIFKQTNLVTPNVGLCGGFALSLEVTIGSEPRLLHVPAQAVGGRTETAEFLNRTWGAEHTTEISQDYFNVPRSGILLHDKCHNTPTYPRNVVESPMHKLTGSGTLLFLQPIPVPVWEVWRRQMEGHANLACVQERMEPMTCQVRTLELCRCLAISGMVPRAGGLMIDVRGPGRSGDVRKYSGKSTEKRGEVCGVFVFCDSLVGSAFGARRNQIACHAILHADKPP